MAGVGSKNPAKNFTTGYLLAYILVLMMLAIGYSLISWKPEANRTTNLAPQQARGAYPPSHRAYH